MCDDEFNSVVVGMGADPVAVPWSRRRRCRIQNHNAPMIASVATGTIMPIAIFAPGESVEDELWASIVDNEDAEFVLVAVG